MPDTTLQLDHNATSNGGPDALLLEFDKLVQFAENRLDSIHRKLLVLHLEIAMVCAILFATNNLLLCYGISAIRIESGSEHYMFRNAIIIGGNMAAYLITLAILMFSIVRAPQQPGGKSLWLSVIPGGSQDAIALNDALNIIHDLHRIAEIKMSVLQAAEMRIRLSRLPIGNGVPRR